MNRVYSASGGDVDIPRREIYRYFGCAGEPDAATAALVENCAAEFAEAASYRASAAEFDVSVSGDSVDFGVFSAKSAALALNLRGCSRAILFAATAGPGPDRQKSRAAVTSPARAAALDAIGTAAVEAWCERLCALWSAELRPGLRLRPRFSPGYGDLPLETQRPLLGALDAARLAGITLTAALMMTPQKSVTAIAGLSADGRVERGDCCGCGKTDCGFRADG